MWDKGLHPNISPFVDTTTPWLARITEVSPNKWHLLDPFNLEDYLHSDPSVTTGINLIDSHILEVAKPWSLQAISGKTMSKKVVGGLNLDGTYDFDFAVLAQLELPLRSGQGGLVFNRFGEKWVRIKGTFGDDDEENRQYRILDIAYHNGLFYAFDLVNWKVGVIDPSETEISLKFMIAPNCLGETIDDSFSVSIDGGNYIVCGVYLVPCNAQLYLVISSSKVGSEKATLFVFVLKQGDTIEENKWERVASLGDEILFIGYDVSFGVSSTVLPNWKPGSICLFIRPFPLFYDSCMSMFQGLPEGAECIKVISYPEYWRYLRMYNMDEEEKGMVGFEELSMKEYTGLFFPPPAWVKWSCPTLDNVDIRLHNLKFSRLKKLG
ncbi:F-box protein At2g17036-like [Silene latifolia]|uniref:F-box protein At2g17036-like n=1 Tax=Silene latifolia TaxID=37657 RepID=UPI003D774130